MFRIEFLKLKKHPQLGDIDLYLSEEEENKNIDKPYTSVIIGANGTGKSFILRTVAEIFRQFKAYSLSDKKEFNLPFDIHLRYIFYHNTYEIVTRKMKILTNGRQKEYLFFKNRPLNVDFNGDGLVEKITNFEVLHTELEYPEKLLVNSIIPTDRFVYQNTNSGDFYQYLGARSTTSTTSTKSSVRRTIKHIFNATTSNNEFLVNLKNLLSFLEFEESFKVTYKTKINRLFFLRTLNKEDFRKYFENWWDEKFDYTTRKKENPLWSIPYYNNHFKDNEQLTDALIDYLNRLPDNKKSFNKKPNSSSNIIILDLFDPETSSEDMMMISHLENLDIINLEGIQIQKSKALLSVNDLSSGEYHLLLSLIGLFANISNDSLILIDEPEISLHPNWQMRYISFLKQVFSKYSSCHFILTTHSHFLVSDLEGKSSAVIALNRDLETQNLSAQLLDGEDTYCWSPDDILYNIFNVVSSRNKFVAEEIANILDELSNGSKIETNKVKDETYNTLIRLQKSLKNSDPLKDVVNSILKQIK